MQLQKQEPNEHLKQGEFFRYSSYRFQNQVVSLDASDVTLMYDGAILKDSRAWDNFLRDGKFQVGPVSRSVNISPSDGV